MVRHKTGDQKRSLELSKSIDLHKKSISITGAKVLVCEYALYDTYRYVT